MWAGTRDADQRDVGGAVACRRSCKVKELLAECAENVEGMDLALRNAAPEKKMSAMRERVVACREQMDKVRGHCDKMTDACSPRIFASFISDATLSDEIIDACFCGNSPAVKGLSPKVIINVLVYPFFAFQRNVFNAAFNHIF